MSRVERFRRKRSIRRRYISAGILFFLIFASGVLIVDSSTNYLMSGRQSIALIEFNSNPAGIEIGILNEKVYINTEYINRDMNRLKIQLKKLLG